MKRMFSQFYCMVKTILILSSSKAKHLFPQTSLKKVRYVGKFVFIIFVLPYKSRINMRTLNVKVWQTIIRSKYILRANNDDVNYEFWWLKKRKEHILCEKVNKPKYDCSVSQQYTCMCHAVLYNSSISPIKLVKGKALRKHSHAIFPIGDGDATTIARRSENLSVRC